MKIKRINLLLTALFSAIVFQSYAELQVKATSADRAVARELFRQGKRNRDKGIFTQSNAHLSVRRIQEKLEKTPRLARNKKIIEAALAKERKLRRNYYVFYTAIPYMRVLQDVTRKLYKREVGKEGALKDKAFQFIRYIFNDSTYGKYKDVTDFLVKELKKDGMVDDSLVRLKTILVSTNLAFFGNTNLAGESTYNYFNYPQDHASLNPKWITDCLRSFGYSTGFASELLNLSNRIFAKTGDLFQIFVPKKMINKLGYLSWRSGIPFDVSFVRKIFGRVRLGGVDRITYPEILSKIKDIKEKWKNKNPEMVKLVNSVIQNVIKGKYHLSPFLMEYKRNPQSLIYLNYYQARLLVTNNMLLNPKSGIFVYRYSTLRPIQERAYREQLSNIIQRMEVEKQAREGKIKPQEGDELRKKLRAIKDERTTVITKIQEVIGADQISVPKLKELNDMLEALRNTRGKLIIQMEKMGIPVDEFTIVAPAA